MKSIGTLVFLCIGGLAVSGCAPVDYSTGSTSSSKSTTSGIPDGTLHVDGLNSESNDPGSSGSLPPNLKGDPSCVKFLTENEPVGDPETSTDRSIRGAAGFINVPLARDVEVSHVAGAVSLGITRNITAIDAVAGFFMARATEDVGSISSVAGFVCVAAGGSIGRLQAGAGVSTVIAQEIDSIESVAGRLNIYGAHVKSVKRVAGRICLYDGAIVDSMESFAGVITPCND